AMPFLLLGFVPRLAQALPRPGAWMETFKQLMAYPLYLTAVWLLWVLARQAGADALGLALIGLVLLAFASWRAGQGQGWGWRLPRYLALGLALAVLAHPLLRAGAPAAPHPVAGWEPYSDARLAELRAEGRTVLVDFTADWCITCKVNEKVVLDNPEVKAALARAGVALLVGDWTRYDPAITAVLTRYGRSGVPLYLLSKQGAEPIVLPQVLTPGLLIDAVGGS
ncbi:MAG TPA: thioredoxin family protein, partial [Nevskiaceae bacterium]|nr:thioredoxin family protein [Nevskiaceae bacterium]